MAVIFDADGDYLNITTGEINPNNAYTWMTWVFITSLPSADACVIGFDGGSLYEICGLDSSNRLKLQIYDNGGFDVTVTGSTLSANTWYHVAIVRESTSSCKVYLNGSLDITNTADVSGRDTSAYDMFMGAITAAIWPLRARYFAQKAWTVSKTIDEVVGERYYIEPMNVVSLYGDWSHFNGATPRLADYSGNGHTWTSHGTLTDGDGSPVTFGYKPYWVLTPPAPAAAGGASIAFPPASRNLAGIIVR